MINRHMIYRMEKIPNFMNLKEEQLMDQDQACNTNTVNKTVSVTTATAGAFNPMSSKLSSSDILCSSNSGTDIGLTIKQEPVEDDFKRSHMSQTSTQDIECQVPADKAVPVYLYKVVPTDKAVPGYAYKVVRQSGNKLTFLNEEAKPDHLLNGYFQTCQSSSIDKSDVETFAQTNTVLDDLMNRMISQAESPATMLEKQQRTNFPKGKEFVLLELLSRPGCSGTRYSCQVIAKSDDYEALKRKEKILNNIMAKRKQTVKKMKKMKRAKGRKRGLGEQAERAKMLAMSTYEMEEGSLSGDIISDDNDMDTGNSIDNQINYVTMEGIECKSNKRHSKLMRAWPGERPCIPCIQKDRSNRHLEMRIKCLTKQLAVGESYMLACNEKGSPSKVEENLKKPDPICIPCTQKERANNQLEEKVQRLIMELGKCRDNNELACDNKQELPTKAEESLKKLDTICVSCAQRDMTNKQLEEKVEVLSIELGEYRVKNKLLEEKIQLLNEQLREVK